MRTLAHILESLAAASQKLVACLVMLAVLSIFSLRAQDSGASVKVLFPFDNASVNENYLGNAAALAEIATLIGTGENASVVVTTFSSPEGNWHYNKDLSRRRAASVKAYLESNYPAIAGNIVLNTGAEAWDDLAEKVKADARLTDASRDAILRIISSDDDPDVKEQKLASQPQYKSLYATFFRSLRYADISLRIENSTQTDSLHTDSEISETVKTPVIARKTATENGLPTVFYAVSEDFIRPSYMGNDAAMKEIIRLLRSGKVRSMVLEGTASPDGNAKANDRLAMSRAENLKNYIVGMFPEMEAHITVVNKGVLEGNEEDYASLRYARIAQMDIEEEVAEETAPHTEVIKTNEAEAETMTETETEAEAVTEAKTETVSETKVETETATEPVVETQRVRAPLFALTTNLLYEAGGAIATGFHTVPLTVGYEIPIGKNFSIQSNYTVTTPWHAWNSNAECAELMHWDLGARWYPGGSFKKPFTPKAGRRVLDGWYASLSAGMGYYDFEHNGKGYQGEEILVSAGLGYGLCFNDHWSLNFGLGFGPMYTRYRYYEGRSNNEHLMYRYSGTFTYFGVTDAKVTLTYLLYYNKKQNRK